MAGEMRARAWVIAKHYGSPEDYGIPEEPPKNRVGGYKFMEAENMVEARR